MRLVVIILAALALGGCAGYMSYNYATAPVTLSGLSATGPVAIAVHDVRPYIVSGNKPASFVGLMRGGYGNPFDVSTESGAPLANDFAEALARALRQRGANVVVVPVATSDSAAAARAKLADARARRGILVTLTEWKSDTMYGSSLHYDAVVHVYDERGNQVAHRSLKGTDRLGMTGLTPHEGVMKAVGARIDGLFEDAKIAAALR